MRRFITIFFVLAFFHLKAQDIHFTQWIHAPHSYNPAQLGNFQGDHRFHANYRNQWSSVTVPFETFAFMADSRKLTKNENFSAGLSALYDVTGDSEFSTTTISAGASYFFKFRKDSLGGIGFAIQPSMTQKKIDLTKLNFDNQFNGNFFDKNLPIGENLNRLSRWYADLAIGTNVRLLADEKNRIELGFSLYNLLKPKQSFYNEDPIRLDRRWNGMVKWDHQLNKKIQLQPSALYSRQGTFYSFNLGANIYYDLSSTKFLTQKVFGGIYARARDAGNLLVGMIHGDWTVAGSYDFNFSTLVPASNFKGGLEIAVIYVIRKALERPVYKSCPPYL